MNSTIVTAGDKRFFWGMYLLVASMRMHGMKNPILCLVKGLSKDEEHALEQFSVKLCRSEEISLPVQAQKPSALFMGAQNAEYITWMDADCLVDGDISERLIPGTPQDILIRFRNREENRLRFRDLKTDGEIPECVKDIWREDVSESSQCKIETTCVTNVLTIHRCNLPLIEKWDRQIRAISLKGFNRCKFAYTHSSGFGISDELILNSLLAYAEIPYAISAYKLNEQKGKYLLHLGLKPKPWEMWTVPMLKYYGLVASIVKWTRQNGFCSPPLPWSFIPALKPVVYSTAFAYEVAKKAFRGVRSR